MFTDDRTQFSSSSNVTITHEMDTLSIHEPQRQNPLDDVFDDADRDHATPRDSESRPNDEVSDAPRLQGIHATNGYREGVAASKERFLQEGFDEGYALGAELGAAAGRLVGLLENLRAAVDWQSGGSKGEVAGMVARAREELAGRRIYAPEYFGEDGIWRYEVVGEREGGEVTFREVADGHPLIGKWKGIVGGVLTRCGLRV